MHRIKYMTTTIDLINDNMQNYNGKVDFIVTDPPYLKENTPEYVALADLCKRSNCKLLICFISTYMAAQQLQPLMSAYKTIILNALRYRQGIIHYAYRLRVLSKSFIVATNDLQLLIMSTNHYTAMFPKLEPKSRRFEWEQDPSLAYILFKKVKLESLRNTTVLDPFMGVGSYPLFLYHASKMLDLDIHIIGIERDPQRYEIAKQRLNEQPSSLWLRRIAELRPQQTIMDFI